MLAKDSMAEYIRTSLNLEPDTPKFRSVFIATLGYMQGFISAFQFQKSLHGYKTISGKDFRLGLHENKYFFPLKMFSLKLSLDRLLTVETARKLTTEFGVRISDSKRILSILQKSNTLRSQIRKKARALRSHTSFDAKSMYTMLNSVYHGVERYTKTLVYRKLRFLANSENLELRDLLGDVMLHVLQAYHKIMPANMSEEHIANYLRRSAHNHAMNMIAAGTTQKRGRLINVGLDTNNQRQFSLTVVSENQMAPRTEDQELVSYEAMGGGYDPTNKHDLQLSVAKILERSRADQKKFRFLCLAMGKENRRFTEWLRHKNLCGHSESNCDVQVRTSPHTFNRWISSFLHLPLENLNSMLLKFRQDLGVKENSYDRNLQTA